MESPNQQLFLQETDRCTNEPPPTQSFPLSDSHTLSLSIFFSPSPSPSLSLSYSVSLCLCLSYTNAHTHTHTETHITVLLHRQLYTLVYSIHIHMNLSNQVCMSTSILYAHLRAYVKK